MSVQPSPAALRRGPPMQLAPLPQHVRQVLRAITAELRNIPRDCIGDRAELLFWLRRMAGRLEGLERMQAPAAPMLAKPAPRPQAAQPRPISPLEAAEAAFKPGNSVPAAPQRRSARVREITSRKGRVVRVETGQLAFAWTDGAGR